MVKLFFLVVGTLFFLANAPWNPWSTLTQVFPLETDSRVTVQKNMSSKQADCMSPFNIRKTRASLPIVFWAL